MWLGTNLGHIFCFSGNMGYLCKSVKKIILIIYAPPDGARGTSAPLFKFLIEEYGF